MSFFCSIFDFHYKYLNTLKLIYICLKPLIVSLIALFSFTFIDVWGNSFLLNFFQALEMHFWFISTIRSVVYITWRETNFALNLYYMLLTNCYIRNTITVHPGVYMLDESNNCCRQKKMSMKDLDSSHLWRQGQVFKCISLVHMITTCWQHESGCVFSAIWNSLRLNILFLYKNSSDPEIAFTVHSIFFSFPKLLLPTLCTVYAWVRTQTERAHLILCS